MSTICKCHGSSLVSTQSEKCSFTYHERDAECEVSRGADEVSHFAVHPAHDVHVDRAALQTSSRESEMYIYSAPDADIVWIFLPAEPCWAEGQTPGSAPCLWTSWLRMCSGRQPRTLLRCCSCTETWEQGEGRSEKGKKKTSKIKFYYCVTSYPKTKRPISHSQNRFTKAPVAKMTLVGLRGGKGKRVIFIYSHIAIPRTLIKVNSPVRHRQRGKRWRSPAYEKRTKWITHYSDKHKKVEHLFFLIWNNMPHFPLYLIPKTLSSRKPPKKQSTTLGQEYQAYSCMNPAVFRSRSWKSQRKH